MPAKGRKARPQATNGLARKIAADSQESKQRFSFCRRRARDHVAFPQDDASLRLGAQKSKGARLSRRDRLGDTAHGLPRSNAHRREPIRLPLGGRSAAVFPFFALSRPNAWGRAPHGANETLDRTWSERLFSLPRARTPDPRTVRRRAGTGSRSTRCPRCAAVAGSLSCRRVRARGGLRLAIVLVEGLVECGQKLRRKYGLDLLVCGRCRTVLVDHVGTLLGLRQKALQLPADRRSQTHRARCRGPGHGGGR